MRASSVLLVTGILLYSLPGLAADSGIELKPSEQPGEIMTAEKYRAYMNLFNHRDLRYAEYYSPDIVFDHGSTGGLLNGREGIIDYYKKAWGELEERLSARNIVIDNDNNLMAVELTTELYATKDVVSIPVNLKKGEHLILTQVLLYGLKNGLINTVEGLGYSRVLTKADELRAVPFKVQSFSERLSAQQKVDIESAFRRYADCFNKQNIHCFTNFYNDDVEFISATLPDMKGPDEIVAFYTDVWNHLRENLVVNNFRYQGKWLYVGVENTLHVFEDYPDFAARPLSKGDVHMQGEVVYELDNGRFSRIYVGIDPAQE